MQRSLFGRPRLFAYEMPERMYFRRFLSIGRAWSLMLTFELPIENGMFVGDAEKGDGFLEFVGGGVF